MGFTGNYKIEIENSGHATVYLANLITNTTDRIVTCDQGTRTGTCNSEQILVQKGQQYYLSVVYNHRSGAPLKLRLGLKAFTTSINSKQSPASKPEKQRITIYETRRHEKQTVELFGDSLPETIKFTMSGKFKDFPFTT